MELLVQQFAHPHIGGTERALHKQLVRPATKHAHGRVDQEAAVREFRLIARAAEQLLELGELQVAVREEVDLRAVTGCLLEWATERLQ